MSQKSGVKTTTNKLKKNNSMAYKKLMDNNCFN